MVLWTGILTTKLMKKLNILCLLSREKENVIVLVLMATLKLITIKQDPAESAPQVNYRLWEALSLVCLGKKTLRNNNTLNLISSAEVFPSLTISSPLS